MSYYYDYERQYGFPSGFPSSGFPTSGGFPSGGFPSGGGNVNRRLEQLENQLQRNTERLNRLNRRLQRVERQFGITQEQW
ncbi:MAG TPA: lysogenization regulator HflD [Bacillus bacterium]|nr:lysogenization regulator HflD [Bacillus sp. (in: firmicutes)]